MTPNRFNIRVYALCLCGNDEVLITHEKIDTFSFIKFPGGGLELGEGIKDCLLRELKEEADLIPQNIQHFYTTDFFQVSAFNPEDQLISVYYTCEVETLWKEKTIVENKGNKVHQTKVVKTKINEITSKDFTFPIDQKVFETFLKSR